MADSPLAPTDTLAPPAAPYSQAFINSDAFVAYHEGGKTRNDGIGHTAAFGIDQNANPNVDVLSLTPRQAQAIRYKYWQSIGGDALAKVDPRAAMIAYDTAIAAGPSVAIKMVRNHQGDAAKMYKARVDFMEGLVAKNPTKFGPVAKSWRTNNDNLGKTLGLIPGTPNMPPLEKLAANGVYTPPGYEADSSAWPKSIRYGAGQKPETAPSNVVAAAPTDTPAEPEKSTFEQAADAVATGITGAAEAKKPDAAPAVPTTKPTVPLPTEPIAPAQRDMYARALDAISKRTASTPPTQPAKPPEAQEKTAPAPTATPVAAPVKEVEPSNDSEA
jgi:hypothetical protein